MLILTKLLGWQLLGKQGNNGSKAIKPHPLLDSEVLA